MGNRVERVQTPVSETQLAQAIIEAWKNLFSETPSKEQVIMVIAQNALETGHRKSMWNYNIGNITTSGQGSFNYFDDLTTKEQISPGKWEKKNLKYRAYPSLLDGVKDYLKLISGNKYASAWEHILKPNPTAFSKALKQIGYYTADEAPYTKQLNSIYNTLSKSDVYEKAKASQIDKDNVIGRYLSEPRNDIYQTQPSNSNSGPMNFGDHLLNTVNKYLQQVAASEKQNKLLYKQYLTNNHCVIHIQSNNVLNSVEFARILCSALDQELLAFASVHSSNDKVEVECSIHGPSEDCFEAVRQLTNVLATTFRKATLKIGGIEIKTKFSMNKKSSYQLMDAKTSSEHYTKFLSKFKDHT